MDSPQSQRKPPPNLRAVPDSQAGAVPVPAASGAHLRQGADAPVDRTFPIEVGTLLNGKYRIDSVLGEGGVGMVYSAQHIELDERVALKFLKAESLATPGLVGRFAREAKAAVSIKSEHVARILDVGTVDGTGAPFIVMEYLEGMDVGAALQLHGVFSVSNVAEYALQVCEALAMAHANGIVHRDIKPENLFLTATQHTQTMKMIKVLDFGISKAALTGSVFRSDIPLVHTVHLMGTPLYMSPEQVRASVDVDMRSDIWSLGMVIYEMLTGTTAFNAASLTELCAAILERDIAPLKEHRLDVPDGLSRAVERCLQKDPAMRFQNVGALASALLPFAPKRARICAERAISVLREAGIADAELKVHSTMPPPAEAAMTLGAEVSQQVRFTPAPNFLAVEATAAPPPPAPRRLPVAIAIVAVGVAVAAILCMVMFGRRAPAPAIAATVDPVHAAPPVVPASIPAATATVEPSAQAVTPEPTVAEVGTGTAPRATSPQSFARVGGSAKGAASPKAVLSAASAGKTMHKARKSQTDEEPDLGY
jgi:serine/threonine protein kinase